ncbi:MAG: XRE family transcriptional regulator [Breznakia sp.]
MKLGNMIKDYRKEKNISMGEFAKLSRVSKAYIGMLEKDNNPSTNKPIAPSLEVIKKVADAMNMDLNILLDKIDGQVSLNNENEELGKMISASGIKVPIYNNLYLRSNKNEEILGYVEVSKSVLNFGTFCALIMNDDSMEPLINEKDTLIIHESNRMENGDICVVTIKDQPGVIRKVEATSDGEIVTLIPLNSNYKTEVYTKKEVNELPLAVIGVIVETRTQIKPLNRLNRLVINSKGND